MVESIPQAELANVLQSGYQFTEFWSAPIPSQSSASIGLNIYAKFGKVYEDSDVDGIRDLISDFYEQKGVGFMIDVERPIKDPGVIIYHVMNTEMNLSR